MQTYPLNALADQFEVDRSVMVKAMRNVPPDLVKPGNRPTWKIATGAKALTGYNKRRTAEREAREARRRETRRRNEGGGGPSYELMQMFVQLDEADAKMRAISTLKGRRAYARETLLPLLHQVQRAMSDDEGGFGLRSEQHLRVFLLSGLGPDAMNGCDWSHEEAWAAYNAIGDDGEDEDAA